MDDREILELAAAVLRESRRPRQLSVALPERTARGRSGCCRVSRARHRLRVGHLARRGAALRAPALLLRHPGAVPPSGRQPARRRRRRSERRTSGSASPRAARRPRCASWPASRASAAPRVIAITEQPDSTLAGSRTWSWISGRRKRVDPYGMIATGSSLFNSAFCDAICVVLLELRGYPSRRFGETHPGGAVGHRLRDARGIVRVARPGRPRCASRFSTCRLPPSGRRHPAAGQGLRRVRIRPAALARGSRDGVRGRPRSRVLRASSRRSDAR